MVERGALGGLRLGGAEEVGGLARQVEDARPGGSGAGASGSAVGVVHEAAG
ncbi:hypothetical protein ACWEQ7_05615 [Streptomyces sp. NPDC004069]|uniref:hypothetical protein n=1 Tax=Streptomyces sp. NPDC052043 TaxID=3365684 RepID=UPI0037D20F16